MPVHIFGIRHHGPGSARNVLNALQEIRPDIVLVEGPPEGEHLLEWATHNDMRPPVAMLAYVPDDPQNAAFYPFVEFSPEWQAIRYALRQRIPVRLMDMPLTHQMAFPKEIQDAETPVADATAYPRRNPISYLAEAAGYDDAEEWWELHFERAAQPAAIFQTIGNAMSALRETRPDDDRMEQLREAFMRRAIRTAAEQMYDTICVVCGAWHAPALADAEKYRKQDDQLLKNLPKTKVESTWIPWTNDRMMFESGYGAGIGSAGWYEHNWQHPDDDGTLWLTKAAHAFRAAQKDVSSAHVIESVRLAHALTTLREIPKTGIYELNEAIRTVMCMGDAEPMQLIREALIVGNRIGTVPDGTPRSPLQKDFEDQLHSLRLKISESAQALSLDLRKENDLEKSRLLHRLNLLGVDWGHLTTARGKGTFKEEWQLYWKPELMIALVEKASWGNTIEAAANKFVADLAQNTEVLAKIVEALNRVLPAELPDGTAALIRKMDALAAGASDTTALLSALPPLADLDKYGNVRKTDREMIANIFESIFYRMLAGLPPGCCGIDDKQAAEIAEKILAVHAAIRLLDREHYNNDWVRTLARLLHADQTAPFLRGTCCKLLYDAQNLDPEQTATEFSKALSPGNPPAGSVQWLEGFLRQSAMVLILDEQIWGIVNRWMSELDDDTFNDLLPLLRRTFSAYTNTEKRKIAEKVKAAPGASGQAPAFESVDPERAQRVIPVLEKLMALN